MNPETSSNINETTESTIKAISGTSDLHEKSFLEVMDSMPGGDDIEFDPPIANILLKPAVFD